MTTTPDLPSKKRVFIGLLIITFLTLSIAVVIIGWVGTVGLQQLHPVLPTVAQLLVGFSFIFLAGIMALLILTVILGKELPFGRKLRGLMVKVFLPMMMAIGRLLGISRDTIKKSFIEINNQLILSRRLHCNPDRILILLPHCLQEADCQQKITTNIDNCQQCGLCDIKDLVKLAKRYGTKIAVATGGTLARKIVQDYRPQIIIAVACERDLTSGINDTYPLPVYGILNQRPNGPCWNTHVAIQQVEKAILLFTRA
ncbi:MAG: DUF116 domain-containing protein [Deltaproteobacteria bacterium]|nr:DUF116 domain-containing protein [Candidatus Anaeroferrophillus wilburensis]MBN2890127.1 DUF116 domain-containing protein [Deltaproteobacteria bacterium]